jgi:hypothetical protein
LLTGACLADNLGASIPAIPTASVSSTLLIHLANGMINIVNVEIAGGVCSGDAIVRIDAVGNVSMRLRSIVRRQSRASVGPTTKSIEGGINTGMVECVALAVSATLGEFGAARAEDAALRLSMDFDRLESAIGNGGPQLGSIVQVGDGVASIRDGGRSVDRRGKTEGHSQCEQRMLEVHFGGLRAGSQVSGYWKFLKFVENDCEIDGWNKRRRQWSFIREDHVYTMSPIIE